MTNLVYRKSTSPKEALFLSLSTDHPPLRLDAAPLGPGQVVCVYQVSRACTVWFDVPLAGSEVKDWTSDRIFYISNRYEPIATQTVVVPVAAPRRGKSIPSEMSSLTLQKARRAGAFFKAVAEPPSRPGEEDPDYGF